MLPGNGCIATSTTVNWGCVENESNDSLPKLVVIHTGTDQKITAESQSANNLLTSHSEREGFLDLLRKVDDNNKVKDVG